MTQLKLEILHTLLKLAHQGKIRWNRLQSEDDEFEAHLGDELLWAGFVYLARTNDEGADRTLVKLSAFGLLHEYAIGTEGFNLIVEMLAQGDEDWKDSWERGHQQLLDSLATLKESL